MSEQHDLEAQERAALRIGDRQAAAKARARCEELAEQHGIDNPGLMRRTSVARLYPEMFD